MPSDITHAYSEKVEACTELAKGLLEMGPEWLTTKRLKPAEIEELVRAGVAAIQADLDQKEQRAEQAVDRTGRSVSAAELFREDAELADVLPAVIHDLAKAGEVDEALFLARVSFARYRVRVVSVPVDPDAPATEETKKVERVEKKDNATRAKRLAAFCAMLRRRPTILAALSERGYDDATLARLEEGAEAVAVHGSNLPQRVEATEREAAAVREQEIQWRAIRRLVKRAVVGVPKLEKLYAGYSAAVNS